MPCRTSNSTPRYGGERGSVGLPLEEMAAVLKLRTAAAAKEAVSKSLWMQAVGGPSQMQNVSVREFIKSGLARLPPSTSKPGRFYCSRHTDKLTRL
jgi:hypothetical protein